MWGYSSHVNDCEILFAFVIALQILIPAPMLEGGQPRKRLARLNIVGKDLDQLLADRSDPTPVLDQAHGLE